MRGLIAFGPLTLLSLFAWLYLEQYALIPFAAGAVVAAAFTFRRDADRVDAAIASLAAGVVWAVAAVTVFVAVGYQGE